MSTEYEAGPCFHPDASDCVLNLALWQPTGSSQLPGFATVYILLQRESGSSFAISTVCRPERRCRSRWGKGISMPRFLSSVSSSHIYRACVRPAVVINALCTKTTSSKSKLLSPKPISQASGARRPSVSKPSIRFEAVIPASQCSSQVWPEFQFRSVFQGIRI